MKITGIVCEYNPMHNGHIYHIEQTRLNGATHIIAVMSGNFVQRGETALMDKFTRASIAVKHGADLVIEIPSIYALSSAEFYARGAVSIMNSLGCVNEISFGSECSDVSRLKMASEIISEIPHEIIENKLKSGMTYPLAITEIISQKYGDEIAYVTQSPNNILAIEYIKALSFLHSDIKPFTISRNGAEHDSNTVTSNTASASYIRECISNEKNFNSFVPSDVENTIKEYRHNGKLSNMKKLERVILYKLRTTPEEELKNIPDVGQGLEYRLKQYSVCSSIESLLESVKTKRYTMARLRRILMNMLIGTYKDDLKILPPYARILAMNEKGREILALCKNSTIPVSTSLSKLKSTGKNAERFVNLESNASDIYGLSQNNTGSKDDDFRAKIRIEKNEN